MMIFATVVRKGFQSTSLALLGRQCVIYPSYSREPYDTSLILMGKCICIPFQQHLNCVGFVHPIIDFYTNSLPALPLNPLNPHHPPLTPSPQTSSWQLVDRQLVTPDIPIANTLLAVIATVIDFEALVTSSWFSFASIRPWVSSSWLSSFFHPYKTKNVTILILFY